AQGLVARVGSHGARADEANADLRDQPRELGDSGHPVRGPVPRDVAAARRARAADGMEVAEAARMSATVLRIADLRMRRGARPILTGGTLDVGRGGLVALMGPSGSGKATARGAGAGR